MHPGVTSHRLVPQSSEERACDNEPKIIRLIFSPEFPSRTVNVERDVRAEVIRHRGFGTLPYFIAFEVVALVSLVVDIFQVG